MHAILPAFGIALANNVDNLGARLAYSVSGIRISLAANAWITVITFAVSLAAAYAGVELAQGIGASVASGLAAVLLIALGVWMIVQSRLNAKAPPARGKEAGTIFGILVHPESADHDGSKHIDFREASVLGIALSVNNVGGGMSAGMLGLDPFLVAALSAAVSFVALWAGNFLAKFFARWDANGKLAAFGGVVLIALAVRQFL